jgi:hypothetical protein
MLRWLCKRKFYLKAHVISWSGDIPAISKILNLTGHNSMNLRLIDHCVGLFKLGSKHYIIDKENNVEEEWEGI